MICARMNFSRRGDNKYAPLLKVDAANKPQIISRVARAPISHMLQISRFPLFALERLNKNVGKETRV